MSIEFLIGVVIGILGFILLYLVILGWLILQKLEGLLQCSVYYGEDEIRRNLES